MPILEPEEYEEVVERSNSKPNVQYVPDDESLTASGPDEEVIGFSAFVSRDTLWNIADDVGMDKKAWQEAFKFAEEWEIEAVVNVKTGMITKARLI